MKYRTRINPGSLNAKDLSLAYWLKGAIKQAQEQEQDEGYQPGELADPYRQQLHDLLTDAAERLKAYQ